VLLQAGQSVSAALGQTNPNNQLFNAPSVVAQSPQVGTAPSDVAVGDLNGDGIPDLVHTLANPGGTTGRVVVQYGLGNGKYFQGDAPSSGGGNPRAVRLADVNGDGNLDAIVANETSGTVAVLLGNGVDPFNSDGPPPAIEPAAAYDGGFMARDLALGDLNDDGWVDIVVGNGYGNSVHVLLNDGDGTFAPAVSYAAGGFLTNGVAIGDVTGDGIPDVVAVTVDNPIIAVLPGVGDGTFGTAVVDPLGSGNPRDLVLGDYKAGSTRPSARGVGRCTSSTTGRTPPTRSGRATSWPPGRPSTSSRPPTSTGTGGSTWSRRSRSHPTRWRGCT
jgi:hypothetical protein